MREPIKVDVISPKKSWLQRISAFAPIFISLVALSLAIDGAIEARQHNKLSVRPYVRFNQFSGSATGKVGLNVENNGLGPAIISKFSIFLDRQPIEKYGFPDWEGVTERVPEMFGVEPEWFWCGDGYVVKSGQTLNLYMTGPENVRDLAAFRKLISERLTVRLHVCSLYDECEDMCSGNISQSDCESLK
jgi:hypothetical protein